MFVSWLLFPLLLAVLCLGWGLLLESLLARRLPGELLAPAGFAALVVVAGILTARGETAPLATPLVAIGALVGIGLAYPWHGRRPDRWALAAALAVFALYAAPVVLSGEPTFAGYIKLDDTATWAAFVDRLMEHGRDLSGLAPSSYQTTLQVNLPSGYPVGAFLPLGLGARLTATDVAWLVQPYMATMAALLALCLCWLARPLVPSRPLRSLLAAAAAASALLYGYALWGGIKELASALAIATIAALVPLALQRGGGWRPALPLAFAAGALIAIAGTGAAVWLGPILAAAAVLLWRSQGGGALLRRGVPFALAALLLGLPAILAGTSFSPTQGGLTSSAELGNLIRPLRAIQYAGVWPVGDFRVTPGHLVFTYTAIAVAVLCAAAGAWLALRRARGEGQWAGGEGPGAAALLLYAGGAAIGTFAVVLYASPWVGAKALASTGPSFLLLALAGAAALIWSARRAVAGLGVAALTLLVAGVLVSDGLAYHDVSLAPYAQLRELEEVGEEFASEGPTLMTEYNPYGVRHFLRNADAEGASELRVRPIPLLDGGEAKKGEWVDTDRISAPSLFTYRTLVLRRSPVQSRPPAAYRLVRHGLFYDIWQRPAVAPPPSIERLPLGSDFDPAAVPRCADVLRLAAALGPSGRLAAAPRRPTVFVSLGSSRHPAGWVPTEAGSPDLIPTAPGTARAHLVLPSPGRYEAFALGSVRNRLSLSMDGAPLGAVSSQLNESAQYLYFGAARLGRGPHALELSYGGQTLAPGSGGPSLPIGPVLLSPNAVDPPVVELAAARARQLCGRHLDWVEALAPGIG